MLSILKSEEERVTFQVINKRTRLSSKPRTQRKIREGHMWQFSHNCTITRRNLWNWKASPYALTACFFRMETNKRLSSQHKMGIIILSWTVLYLFPFLFNLNFKNHMKEEELLWLWQKWTKQDNKCTCTFHLLYINQ